jgi:hypothetical protein
MGVEDFLRLMNEQNNQIAAREVEEEVEHEENTDQIRLSRMEEHRKKWDRLRARPRKRNRPSGARPVWDTIDLNVD